MAPLDHPDHSTVEKQIKEIIHSLYTIMVQVATYDTQGGPPTRQVLAQELQTLSRSLQTVHRTASDPVAVSSLPSIPSELVQYVEAGRNPDIYTREFVELVRRTNQLMRGKMHAFASFRDVLAEEMGNALPELREDVGRVVAATGGRPGGAPRSGGGAQQQAQQA